MKILGRASASQVISSYRDDFVLREKRIDWPELQNTDINHLAIKRVAAIANAGRPLFFPLEAVWDVYEVDKYELLQNFWSMWGEPANSLSLRDAIEKIRPALNENGSASNTIRLGTATLPQQNLDNLAYLRSLISGGQFSFGTLVSVRTELIGTAQRESSDICLLDGHHRIIAAELEDKLPEKCKVFLGDRPIQLGLSILNGATRIR